MGVISCRVFDAPNPGIKIWYEPGRYSVLATSRSRRCCSCGEKISVGDTCCEIHKFKCPETEIERRIYGENGEVPRASSYMCARCAGICFSLNDIGFGPYPLENQAMLAEKYAEEMRLSQSAMGAMER